MSIGQLIHRRSRVRWGRSILALLVIAAGLGAAASLAPASPPSAGDLDPSYGTGGAVLDDFYGTQDPDQANAVTIQPDGKVVIAGSTGTGGYSPIAMVARYNANGTRDPSFGPPPHGFMKAQICFSSSCGSAEADAVALMGNGDIVVAGVAVNNACFFVMRLTPSGALDSTLAQAGGNAGGVDAFRIGAATTGYHVGGVAVQSDGNVVVDGSYGSPSQSFIARVSSSGGALDPGWNGGFGYTTFASTTRFSALALQPSDGKAVAVGTDVTNNAMLIVRFTTAGAQDTTTFNNPSGYSLKKVGAGPDTGAAVVATSDGRLLVAGTDQTGSNAGIGLFQFKQSDGTLDTTFAGGAGDERVALPSGDAGSVTALALDNTGNLLVAGQDTTKNHTFVARLAATGTLDSSFGSGGFSIPAIGTSDGAQAVTGGPDGNPVVAGFGTPSGASDTDAMTARLLGTTPPPPASTATTSTTGSTGTTTGATTTGAPTPSPTTTTPSLGGPPLLALSHVAQTHRTWREGNALAKLAAIKRRRPPVGTTFSFTLDERATVTLAFVQREPGRRVNRKCIAPTKRNRKKPSCKRGLPRGALVVAARSGPNRLAFDGRLSRTRKLQPGSYTVTITAAVGRSRSRPTSLSFKIVR